MASAGDDATRAAAPKMQAAYEDLFKAVGANRQLRAACPRLFRDMLAVLTGIRPAFMLDYGVLPAHNMAAAVAALAATLALGQEAQQCCVVVLNDCCYLVRPGALPQLVGAEGVAEVAGAGAEVAWAGAEVAGAGAAEPVNTDGVPMLPAAATGPAGAAGGAGAAGSHGDTQQAQQEQARGQRQGPPPVMFVAFEGPQACWAAPDDATAAAGALQALRVGLMAVLEERQLRHEERAGCSNITSSMLGWGLSKSAAPLPVVHTKSIPGWRAVVPPTASGYLLGYPALYMCHTLAGAQAASRGLSSGSLCLHTVACQLAAMPAGVPQPEGPAQPLLGFSVPAELATDPAWEACWQAWRARLEGAHDAAGHAGHAGRLVTWQPMQVTIATQMPRPVAL